MDNFDNKLHFSVEKFRNDSLQIYKNLIEKNIKESFDEIYNKIDTEIKNNISINTNCKKMYDYSTLEDISINGLKYNNQELIKFINEKFNPLYVKCLYTNHDTYYENLDKFCKFDNNEKVVIYYNFKQYEFNNHSDKPIDEYIFITNYSKILCITINQYSKEIQNSYNEINFWIPLDYIIIINE